MLSFIAAQYGTISDIEVVWTLIALFGLIFSVFNVREALIDRKVLKISGVKNGRKMIADYSLISESARATIQTIFLVVGILAMTLADAIDSANAPWNVVLIGVVFRWGLILSASLISLKSFLAWRLRKELRKNIVATPINFPTTTAVTGTVVVAPNDLDNGSTIVAHLESEEAEGVENEPRPGSRT
jgi:hypothetical protein